MIADMPRPTRHFTFILADLFPMFCLAAAIDVLRSANRMSDNQYYSWSTVSHDGNPVFASNKLAIQAACSVDTMPPADIYFVVAGLTTEYVGKQKVVNVLRTLGRRGASLGGISIGSHTLAEAGQLEGHRCTIHWENRASFREAFPHIECTGNVYEIRSEEPTS